MPRYDLRALYASANIEKVFDEGGYAAVNLDVVQISFSGAK